MNEATRAAIALRLGSAIQGCQRLAGGDINEAFALRLADGRRLFAKTNCRADSRLFQAEARGLEWLAAAGALRVPAVIAVGTGDEAGASPFLLLELLEPGPRVANFDERLGQELAALHRFGAAQFGLDHDNFIALLPQDNRSAPGWGTFYRERRLLPLVERAREHGLTDAGLDRMLDRLLARLDALVGPAEPPARLHGDLWGGNLHVDSGGLPVLIDPAVYGGQREMDLAMMRLFGGFGERVFDAYAAAHPLEPGHRERVALCQLYPLLVHLNSFGAGYAAQVRRCVARYV